MSLRTRWLGNFLSWFDSTTDESILPIAPVFFEDDFVGRTWDTTNRWGTRDTNGATESLKANQANGVVELALAATNEIELGGMDWADQLPLVVNQKLVFEARIRFTVLPTAGALAVVGLCDAFNAAVDSVAHAIWFRVDGSGALTVEHDDGTHETSKIATGVTLIANQWTVLRVECDVVTALRFYIDGARVASATAFDFSAAPSQAMQPVARIGKESASTAVGTLQVDYVRCWMARS